ncbi:unnamed protein product [Moneuplotes crassus]|uniref:RING-type domain-containing protein n=1 Tax=Euplotes crassus TaxID=5936 RepID=A0AAD2CVY9_EUPCR|nr:unnamed protein product [Moneuplotes crassus]
MSCISDLCSEFAHWVCSTKVYSTDYEHKQKVITKLSRYLFCSCISLIASIIILTAKFGGEQDNFEVIGMGTCIGVFGVDVMVFFVRRLVLKSSRGERNWIRLIHAVIHIAICCLWGASFGLAFDDLFYEHRYTRVKVLIFLTVFVIQLVRILHYSLLTLVYIILAPCILCTILRERREQRRSFNSIRASRYRGSLERRLLEFQLDEQENNYIPLLVRLDDEAAELPAPPREYLGWGRRSFLEFLRDNGFFENNEEEIPLEKLKRFRYEELKEELDYEECSICICAFSEVPDELLIVLPCNVGEDRKDKMHVFHEECILEWIKKHRKCPLCRADITKEVIMRYNPDE